ncbi:hypothetical protein [Actinopolymorpha sp. B9G3]|uniref:hypothetical protein n=1 Tax=Actinopolymorpha sp. B9G3 TaxID=3158970 RepID=UPI0032D8BA60
MSGRREPIGSPDRIRLAELTGPRRETGRLPADGCTRSPAAPSFADEITTDDEVRWDCAATDNDTARALLEEFYNLPEAVHTSASPADNQKATKHHELAARAAAASR